MVPASEDIPSDAQVSRLIDSPLRWSAAERTYIESKLFEFETFKDDGGRPYEEESLVWRKYAVEIAEVHAMGCQQQHLKRQRKPEYSYEGAMTTTVREIRGLKTKPGHGFVVIHDPKEGVWHAVVRIARADGWMKAHKVELRDVLSRLFAANHEKHQCEDLAGAA